MTEYQRSRVFAPAWLEYFSCLGGSCPCTCCQKWDIEVDSSHAELYQKLDDPELSPILGKLLLKMHIKHPQPHEEKDICRLNLLRQPGQRCTLLSPHGTCRLQEKYGAEVLCDTCYFFPRLFFQIDQAYNMTASLSCPEVARLAIADPHPVQFKHFETEIDPGSDWLEPLLIADEDCRRLLVQRETIVMKLIELLQQREYSMPERVYHACLSLLKLAEKTGSCFDIDAFRNLSFGQPEAKPVAERSDGIMLEQIHLFLRVFDWGSSEKARPLNAINEMLFQLLSNGRDSAGLIAAYYADELRDHYLSFLLEHQYMEENYLVHFVFSEMFKQFDVYQNEGISAAEVLRFEAALLAASFCFFRILQCKNSMQSGMTDRDQFMNSIYEMDNNYLHYGGWLSASINKLAPEYLSETQLQKLLL